MEAETAPPPETTEAVEAAPQVKQVEAAAVVEEAPAADNGDDNKPEEAVEPEESVSNGNGTSVSEPDDKPESEAVEAAEVTENADIEEPEEEKMDTSEAADEAPKEEGDEERKDEPEESKAEDEAGKDESEDKKEEVPADSFDQMLSASDKKDTTTTEDDKKDDEENKDSFDKMLSAGGDDDTAEKKDEDSEDKKDDADVSEEKKDDVDSEDKKDDADSEEKKDDGEEKKDDAAATTISGDPFDDSTVEPNKDDEVITITSEKAVTDEKYYEELNPEELAWLKEHVPGIDSVYTKLQCTTCSKIVDPVISTAKGVNRHPHLGICICQPCRQFYGDGDWPRSEDGDEYCRMCGQGGDILLCDKCPNAFCKKCLQRNLGSRALREITKAEEWNCLVCDPSPLHTLKALYYCVYISQVEIKERREKDREAARERERSRKQKSTGVTNKEKQALVKSPQNFLEENISEAFKTLEVYQKSLETERTRCIKTVKEGMSVDMATSITRKLRKLYAVTQKNMDLLDRAIVESYVENFPTESTRIHMGRVAPHDPPTPVKSSRRVAAASNSKSKIRIKGKKKAAPAKGKSKAGPASSKKKKKKKKVIQMNGSPVYGDADEYVVPSLTGGKRKKKRGYKDDDVECIDVSESDSEFYRPKKRARPGPASSKRSKPGPASKKRAGPKSKTTDYY